MQVSAGGACAGGWESGVFPDGFPFYCGTEVNGGQRSNLYGCNSLNLAHSGYTPGANDDACGCPEWEEQGIDAPPISTCEGHNNEWIDMAQPFAKYLKKGCPTAYTFPYDDQTSTFDCASEGYGEADFVNTQSCEFLFYFLRVAMGPVCVCVCARFFFLSLPFPSFCFVVLMILSQPFVSTTTNLLTVLCVCERECVGECVCVYVCMFPGLAIVWCHHLIGRGEFVVKCEVCRRSHSM